LSDLFYLFFTVWMFLTSPAGWQRLLLDTDSVLHTRTGQYIIETGTIPHLDLFSYTKPGQHWVAYEWLSEVIFALTYNLASYKGLALFGGTIIALYLTFLLKYTIWRGANGLIALVVMLITATATSIHYFIRPHLFTLLLLAMAMAAFDYNRRRGGRLLGLLVPMVALWANLHGGFAVFFALLGVRVTGCAVEAWLWKDLREARRGEAVQLTKLGLACALASLANPYGIGLHLHVLETLRNPWIQANVAEFLSPDFRTEEMMHFMILLFAGLGCVGPLVRKREIGEALSIVVLAYASLVSVRHLTIYALVAAPLIACELSGVWRRIAGGRGKASLLGTLRGISETMTERMPGTSWLIPVSVVILAVTPGIAWPIAFPEEGVPVAMIEKHRDLLARARVFAPDQVANYLIFRSYPRQRVFFDTRHNYYGPEAGNEYLAVIEGKRDWGKLLDKYRVEVLLIKSGGPLASLALASGEWRTVDSNGRFALMERSMPLARVQ
jgi:hypothetical protein